MHQQGLIKFKQFGGMINEDLEMKILLRQNTELVAKLQWYRRQNQELKTKNENLNTSVQNLSEVFAAASASWQSVTLMEESLLALMRKKTEIKDKTLLRKYIFHFKTFAGIIDNLGDKITNAGHSDQSAQDAKIQLDSFVKNYEIFFKEFVETYFKFNDDSIQLLQEIKNKPDANTTTKAILNQSLEQKQKIKDFQTFMESLKENCKLFQDHNSSVILAGAIKAKESEIHELKKTIYMLERRNRAIFDYNNLSVENQIQNKDLECFCGGAQLAYMKRQWEENLKNISQGNQILKNKISALENGDGGIEEQKKVDEEKYLLLEEQKQSLINRNQLLLEKIDKMRVQYKLTDEMIMKSNIYLVLRDQCQYLMDYVSDLLGKYRKNQDYLTLIERNREEEIRELRKKVQKNKFGNQPPISPINSFQQMTFSFKTQALNHIKELRNSYLEVIKEERNLEQNVVKFKKEISELSKMNEELQRKLNDHFARELSKTDNIEFRHQKFKAIQTDAGEILANSSNINLIELWKEFLAYVKSRDKKIRDLESVIRKKEKEIVQKSKFLQAIQENLDETEKMYNQNKAKLDRTQQFIKKMEKELIHLAEENFNKKSQFQQEKALLSLRLKSETDTRNKLEQKLALVGRVDEQIQEMRRNQSNIQKNYQEWMENEKKNLQTAQMESNEKDIVVKNINDELSEREKQLSKLQGEKEAMKSEIRQLKSRVESLTLKSEDEVMRLEMEHYKSKIMCIICSGDREREVGLKTCPHLFCRKCIDDTQNSRNRKCPSCGIKFTKTDIHEIKWN